MILTMAIAKLLETEASGFGITLTPEQINKLEHYHSILEHWNQRLNLVSVTQPLDLVRFHFLESLYVDPYLPPESREALDIGSGAGFPAIPLKIIRDDLSPTLLEARKRKAAFLKEVARALSLTDVKVCDQRLEEFLHQQPKRLHFDVVTGRGINLSGHVTGELIERLRKDCLLVLWHGNRSPFIDAVRRYEGLIEIAIIRVPLSRNRYIHFFRKL